MNFNEMKTNKNYEGTNSPGPDWFNKHATLMTCYAHTCPSCNEIHDVNISDLMFAIECWLADFNGFFDRDEDTQEVVDHDYPTLQKIRALRERIWEAERESKKALKKKMFALLAEPDACELQRLKDMLEDEEKVWMDSHDRIVRRIQKRVVEEGNEDQWHDVEDLYEGEIDRFIRESILIHREKTFRDVVAKRILASDLTSQNLSAIIDEEGIQAKKDWAIMDKVSHDSNGNYSGWEAKAMLEKLLRPGKETLESLTRKLEKESKESVADLVVRKTEAVDVQ